MGFGKSSIVCNAIFVILFSSVFVFSPIHAEEVNAVQTIILDGIHFPITQFEVTPEHDPFCAEPHYHITLGYTIDAELIELEDPNPDGCGQGTVNSIPIGYSFMTDTQISTWVGVTGIELVFEEEIPTNETGITLDSNLTDGVTVEPPEIIFDERTIVRVDDPTLGFDTVTTGTGEAPVVKVPCPTIKGTGNPGDKVHIFINMGGVFNFNTVTQLSTTVDENGDWEITLEPPCPEDGYYDIGITYESPNGQLTHIPEFPIVIDTGSGISTEVDQPESAPPEDDGDDPRDTPPPTIFGEEIDEEATCLAYVTIGDVTFDANAFALWWNSNAIEGVAHEAISDFEDAGYDVIFDDSASHQEILDTLKDERIKAFWFLGHGQYRDVMVHPSEAPLKALFLPPNEITETIPIPSILSTDRWLYGGSWWGTPVLSNTNLNQATVHACGQNLPPWHTAFSGAEYDSWTYPVTTYQIIWWQIGATYPDIEPTTCEEAGSSSKPAQSGTEGNKGEGCLCSNEGCYLDPMLTTSSTSEPEFCEQNYNFFISDPNHDEDILLYGVELKGCSIDKSTISNDPIPNANFNLTMSTSAIRDTMEDPLNFEDLVSDGEVTIDINVNQPSKEVLLKGFREIVFPIYPADPPSHKAIPAWIRTVAGWWTTNQVSDDTFIDAIRFLVEEDILELPLQTNHLTLTGDIFPIPDLPGKITDVLVTGRIDAYVKGNDVYILIENPQGIITEQKLIATSEGKYTTSIFLNHNSPVGKYTIVTKYLDEFVDSVSFVAADSSGTGLMVQPTKDVFIPNWVKENALLWNYGYLTDDQFLVGIQWLIETGVIDIS